MVALRRTGTGLWSARKAIPADVREAYGKREEKKTWPASLSKEQAKAELGAWLAPIEERISLLRSANASAPVSLTPRQCRAMAGEWYKAMSISEEERFTESPRAWDWDADIAAILPEGEADPDEPLRPFPFVVEARDRLLAEQGLRVDAESSERLLQDMLSLYLQFLRLMQRRCAGDYGEDPVIDTLPKLETQQQGLPKGSPKVSLTQLFEEFAARQSASPHTIRKWRRAIESFVSHLGHDDATKATRSDAHSWFDSLLATGLSVRTVRMTYRAALARIFKVAHDRGRLNENPMQRLEVFGPKAAQTRRKDLSDTEAQTILSAALGPQPERLSPAHARARRWVPWICAYTGARVNEITQLRAMDIRQVDGVWVFHITPEAGSVKTRKARSVPIHSHLLEQGITDLAKAGDETPLFYDPAALRKGSKSHPLHTQMGSKLAKWVRSLGVTEVQSPNHGWRHRFKTLARRVGMDPEARDAIQGHVPKTEGQAYGEWPLDALRAEVEKLPPYFVAMPAGD